jgi:dTDP-4-dehydrorhamnose 3,5-epimerase
VLTSEKKNQFFIPRGFAHGFLVLSDEAEFVYKCDEFYHPEDEGGIRWDDPSIGIEWPEIDTQLIMSIKDQNLKPWSEVMQ